MLLLPKNQEEGVYKSRDYSEAGTFSPAGSQLNTLHLRALGLALEVQREKLGGLQLPLNWIDGGV